MRAAIPSQRILTPINSLPIVDHRKIEGSIAPLVQLADNSDYLIAGSIGEVTSDNERFQIPRFIFMGPMGGGYTIRLGIFAGIQGNDWQSVEALKEFLLALQASPEIAAGYHIYAYPICNPAGFANKSIEDDLAVHFWKGSKRPEAYYLEREIGVLQFQGVISLQTLATRDRFSASTPSSILKTEVVGPALEKAHGISVADRRHPAVDTTSIVEAKPGFLTTTDELQPPPFEINFSIPHHAPPTFQIRGTILGLKSIMNSYRTLLAIRQDL